MKLPKFLSGKSEWWLLALLLAIFVALKIPTLAPRFADGWIYFYFGKLISEGATPYIDFYYSSPPLIPYFMGLLHSLFGFQLAFAEVLPHLFSIADAILIFVLLRKKIGGFVFLAVGAYLFSFLNFATADYFSEAHPLTTLALAGILFFENREFFWSGIFFGLAGLTKLYGILPAVFLPLLIIREPRNLAKFFGGIFISFGIPNLVFLAVVGREYLNFIFFNHLQKGVGIPKLRLWSFFALRDFWLLLALALPLCLAKNFKRFAVPLIAAGTFAVFYLIFKDIYYLYFKIFLALLVISLAFVLSGELRKVASSKILAVVLVLLAVNSIFLLKNYFGSQIAIAQITNLDDIVADVRAKSFADESIYGSFSITPLVALLADRPIFRNYVDTNSKFIDLGVIDTQERAQELLAAHVPVVITKVYINPQTLATIGIQDVLPDDFFLQHCPDMRSFPIPADYESNAVIVWSCE
ncbi:MAG: glycosyltransferase family 39 protein [Candidatus Peribacteraceae bacterium]|nr:glycosyltransferase family 39 protein [Candidatus Peribacteraceae bacterium]